MFGAILFWVVMAFLVGAIAHLMNKQSEEIYGKTEEDYFDYVREIKSSRGEYTPTTREEQIAWKRSGR